MNEVSNTAILKHLSYNTMSQPPGGGPQEHCL